MMKHLRTLLLAGFALGLLVTGADAAWNLIQKGDGSAAFRKDGFTTGRGNVEAVIGRTIITVPLTNAQIGITEFVTVPITGVIRAAWIAMRSVASATVSLQLFTESATQGSFLPISATWAVNATQSAGFTSGIGEGSAIAISTTNNLVRRYRPVAVRTLANTSNGNQGLQGIVTIVIDPE